MPLFFTSEALEDLQHILQYTIETWGQDQADNYNKKLDQTFQRLKDNPAIGQPREDILQGYHSLLVEKHIIFYWLKKDAINVIRILHQRQDPLQHL